MATNKLTELIKNNQVLVSKTALLFIFLALLASTIINAFYKYAWTRSYEFRPPPFDEAKESNYVKQYSSLLNQYTEKSRLYIESEVTRNFFAPVIAEEQKMPFSIINIVFEPFILLYMGHIEKRPGELIAQINWGERTYFVKQGDTIKEWRVLEVTRKKVLVKNTRGESITFPLQQQVLSKKPYAILRSSQTEKEIKINVGDEAEGYKVLDITEDAVILSSQLGEVTISK